MFYEGTLHSRGAMEAFTGYLRGVIQPKTDTPMAKAKLYEKMINMAVKSPETNSTISSIVNDMFQCMKIDSNNLSDEKEMKIRNGLIKELDNLYESLSTSAGAARRT